MGCMGDDGKRDGFDPMRWGILLGVCLELPLETRI